jgi:hypothetical protein
MPGRVPGIPPPKLGALGRVEGRPPEPGKVTPGLLPPDGRSKDGRVDGRELGSDGRVDGRAEGFIPPLG